MSIANRHSVMIFYADTVSPISHCIRLVLAEKDVSVEIHYLNKGDSLPDDLVDSDPYDSGVMLVDRDLVLYEPQIMMEYLDERFPHPPLLPVDPVSRANNRQFRFRVFRDLYALTDSIESSSGREKIKHRRKIMRDHLTAIAPIFAHQPYFMSDEYTLVDCCIAPLLWRLSEYGIKLPASAKPLLKYADLLFKREAFRTSLSEAEQEMRGTRA